MKGESRLAHSTGKKNKEQDWLTGFLNRQAFEERVNGILEEKQLGVLLVMDIDRFKLINEQYGHNMGDQLLQEVARVLSMMFFKTDMIGRIGEDEFAVFLSAAKDQEFIAIRTEQLQERFKEIHLANDKLVRLSITVGGSLYQPGDCFRSMYDRAKEQMAANQQVELACDALQGVSKSIEIDMKLIRRSLAEQEMIPGAYCQDFETFKSIYRFMERRMRRIDSPAFILLLTLTDGQGSFPPLTERERYLTMLKNILQKSLRAGDVFTQYSSCQMLVMVLDLSAENAEDIAQRIEASFYKKIGYKQGSGLLHHCYPMQAAGK